MTRELDNGILLIEEEEPDTCELCGVFEETRPYGPNGEKVCYECGMKNQAAAEAAFFKRLGVSTIH